MGPGGEADSSRRNVLCSGADRPLSGTVQGGTALVRCAAAEGELEGGRTTDQCPLGLTWAFVIDLPLDGTLDMYQDEGGLWNAWIDEIESLFWDRPC